MAAWTHSEAIADGVRLHYVEAGDADDPLVVLLHGFPEFWYSWRDQLPALADAGFHVVAPDMRGYNASEKPHGVSAYGMGELVGDVVGLLDQFDSDAAHVVGHDWGGVVAWAVAIRYPERVDRLGVLNAPHPGRFREVVRTPEQLRRSWYAFAFQVPWLPEALLGSRHCAAVPDMLGESAANPDAFDERDLRRYREAACRPGALRAAINYYRAAFRDEVRREVGALLGGRRESPTVAVPTLLVWGEQDPALGTELTEGLDRWVSDLRVERLPDASHWVQNDRPERVNELLTEFLTE